MRDVPLNLFKGFGPIVLLRVGGSLRFWPVLAAACLGVSLSVVAFFLVLDWEQQRHQGEFNRRSDDLAFAVEKSIDGSLETTHAIASLYAASEVVSRDDFDRFVNRTLTSRPGIQALEWIPRVADSERAEYEASARQDGLSGFGITERDGEGRTVPASSRSEYFPVYYVEPYEGNESALGFDLASNEARLDALNKARDTGKPTASAQITLVQETGNQTGFLLFVPIFGNELPISTIQQRRASLQGFALAVFRVGDLVDSAIEGLVTDGLVIEIVDLTDPSADSTLYQSVSNLTESPASGSIVDLMVADREWSLEVSPISGVTGFAAILPWLVLTAGLGFTGLLTIYLRTLQGRSARIERRVVERTRELDTANSELSRSKEALARKAEELQHFAHHDPLTGLANRALLQDRADTALALARRGSHNLAIITVDLDHFKTVNDTFGHSAGDEVLRSAALRLAQVARGGDTVARIGGNEFVALVHCVGKNDAVRVAERFVGAFDGRRFRVAGGELRLTASVGLSICPDDGEVLEDLIRHADSALYQAKRNGRNRCEVHVSRIAALAGQMGGVDIIGLDGI